MGRNFSLFEQDFYKLASDFLKMQPHMLDEIAMEAETHFTDAFRNQSFDGEPWKPRKVLDRSGRSRIRYRTNRVGKIGELNKYGRSIKGRHLLVKTGQLRGSVRYKIKHSSIVFSAKSYGRYHNEGIGHLPKRQFMGRSKRLEREIEHLITENIKQWLE